MVLLDSMSPMFTLLSSGIAGDRPNGPLRRKLTSMVVWRGEKRWFWLKNVSKHCVTSFGSDTFPEYFEMIVNHVRYRALQRMSLVSVCPRSQQFSPNSMSSSERTVLLCHTEQNETFVPPSKATVVVYLRKQTHADVCRVFFPNQNKSFTVFFLCRFT